MRASLALASLILLVLAGAAASADEPASAPASAEAPTPPALDPTRVEAMRADMEAYFRGEKREGRVFGAFGAAAMLSGAGLLLTRRAFARGVAIPVMSVGLIQLGAFGVLEYRTDDQVAGFNALLSTDPAAYKRQELERMKEVNRGFDIYPIAEGALLAGGAAMLAIGAVKGRPGLAGAGAGLAAQSVIMLALDLFATARADLYTERLTAF
jgi:hypothetical protein